MKRPTKTTLIIVAVVAVLAVLCVVFWPSGHPGTKGAVSVNTQAELQKQQKEIARLETALHAAQDNSQKKEVGAQVAKPSSKRRIVIPREKAPVAAAPPEVDSTTRPTAMDFRSGLVCGRDERENLDYSLDVDRNNFVVVLGEGCYGPLVTLPDNTRDWRFQNATGEAGWVAFLSPEGKSEFGPVGLSGSLSGELLRARLSGVFFNNVFGYYALTIPRFRLQGHGSVRLLITEKFAGR